ncbi:MAG TPA: aminotransferase class V-fold PLP-dependent enzyme, partial [Pirellulaceae bacterium]|nr:aminotransferase class V-fold PLP-dependent enzyme [Pirellulaceae bacterium]
MAAFDSIDPNDDIAWSALREHWQLRADTTYLNHGSFGPPPRAVREAQAVWRARLDEQPMDFFVRQYEPAYFAARARLAEFVGASESNLVLAEDATFAMNHVAASFPLTANDEVLLTDHEYGAVLRIWERACQRAGAAPPKIATLPRPLRTVSETVEAIVNQLTPRTKLLIVSHITSATAVTLPVKEICAALQSRGVAVCIDGPHAIAQLELKLDELGCDYYCASCHKWLCGPFGSGFLYVAPQRQATTTPAVLSWGRVQGDDRHTWQDEFVWSGTRDPSNWLALPTAIDFLTQIGLPAFRARTHALARYARQQ